MKNVSLLLKGSSGDVDRIHEPVALQHGSLGFDGASNARVLSPWGFFTTFPLLPAAAVAAGTEKMLITLGTGTEVIARAAKGGVNVKTQATTPADNDNALLIAIATTDSVVPVSAKSKIRFATRVNLTQITFVQFGAGLDVNLTSPLGVATANDGAQFLFDPTDELGLVAANAMVAANFVCAMKVAGVDTYKNSGVKVVAGVDYELAIEIGVDLIPRYYINGVLVATGASALTDGVSLGVVIGNQISGTAAQKDFDCRYVSLERQIG